MMYKETGRGTGKTTQAILSLPKDGYYVCVNESHKHYCRKIAESNNRFDIKFLSAQYLNTDMLRGRFRLDLEVDHSVQYSEKLYEFLYLNRTRPEKNDKYLVNILGDNNVSS